MLEYKEDERISLATELEFAHSFAFLLEVRFARKFRVVFPEANPLPDCTVLPFTLQLLIDNAIRHNRMSAAEPLVIEITLVSSSYLRVSNNLQLRNQPENLQVGSPARGGLATIQQRYVMLTSLPLLVENNGEHFTVSVPLLKNAF